MAEEPEVVPKEAIIPEEELDLELELDNTEDVEAIKARAEEVETFARQAVARAKKAEEELKVLKKPKETPAPVASPQASVEETVLLAQGLPEELLKELKAVAQVRGVSLIKAQSDPIFVAVKTQFDKDQKQKDASLPASRGSGQAKPKVSLETPNLSREEHKRLAMEAMN